MRFATCSSAFDGMQPRYTQTPPGFASGSTSATLSPRSAPRNAAAYPPGPPPTTTSWTDVISRKCNHEDTKTRKRNPKGFLRVFVFSWLPFSSLQRQQERLLEGLDDPPQEADAVGAVDRTVIVRERQRQHQARHELAVPVHRFHARSRDAENRQFGRVHDRREVRAADASQIRNTEAAALHFLERDLAVARFRGEPGNLDRNLDDVLRVGIAHDRHEQPAIGVDGDPDIHVFLEDDFFGSEIDRRVDLWKALSRRRSLFHRH